MNIGTKILLFTLDVDIGDGAPIWYKLHVVKVQGITVNKSVDEYLIYYTWFCKNVCELIIGFGLYKGIYYA